MRNGKTGRQQLKAAKMLPIAARLAAIVVAPLEGPDRVGVRESIVPIFS
jgi:hypothetical protein